MMTLNELLADIHTVPSASNISVTGLTLDSRDVKPGDLFLACMGSSLDGKNFIEQAINKGAAAILSEAKEMSAPSLRMLNHHAKNIPEITIPQLSQKMGLLAARFYQHPSQHMKIIGITGTNGKTSCSQFIAMTLQMMNHPCGIIGTLGSGLAGHLHQHAPQNNLTTPDPITLQKILAQFRTQGTQTVSMEVSSHGLAQGRIQGIHFDTAVFTNLTRDHLDYHGSMENYAKAKRLLFTQPNIRHAVINADDAFGQQLLQELPNHMQVFAYSTENKHLAIPHIATIHANHVRLENHGFTSTVNTPWGDGVLHSQLLGRFNLSNLLAVLTTLGIMGFSLEEILGCLAKLRGIPGRMEVFGGGKKPLIVVDYAHTPDALSQVLSALREYCTGKLWCVFGCGGDRDRGKRPLMGQIAEALADRIILTDDNPRHENSQSIVLEILKGMSSNAPVIIEHDRRRAITHAFECAEAEDVILIAGKGHETYQQIGEEKIPFSDAIEVKIVLE